MKKYIIERHFINGEERLDEYIEGIERIKTALGISGSCGYGFEFGLKLTVDEKKLPQDLKEKIREETKNLPANLWLLYDPEDRGPGTSYRQVLFNPTFKNGIVVYADLDQYVIDTKEALEQLNELIQQVEKEEVLYATGSRDVPVVLATNKRNSDLRIIHELFNSLTIGNDKLRVGERRPNVTPAYAEIGESTSGLYIMNFSHPMYPELTKSVTEAVQIANMNGFATDYYVAIKSAQLGGLGKGYVRSRENKFYIQRDEKEEFESVKRLIAGQTKELGKTDIHDTMLNSLIEKRNTEIISSFYPKEYVELVRELMKESVE
jgi:hypothetical protein